MKKLEINFHKNGIYTSQYSLNLAAARGEFECEFRAFNRFSTEYSYYTIKERKLVARFVVDDTRTFSSQAYGVKLPDDFLLIFTP